MANFVLQVPNTLKSFTLFASYNPNGAILHLFLSFNWNCVFVLFVSISYGLFKYLGAPPGGSGSSSGGGGGPVILEIPIDKIRRPLMRTRANDPNKVKELMDSIKEIGLQVPVTTWSLLLIYFKISVIAFGVYLLFLLMGYAFFGFMGKWR